MCCGDGEYVNVMPLFLDFDLMMDDVEATLSASASDPSMLIPPFGCVMREYVVMKECVIRCQEGVS